MIQQKVKDYNVGFPPKRYEHLTKDFFQFVLSRVCKHIRDPEGYARSLLFTIIAILKHLSFMGKRDGIVEEKQPPVLVPSWMQVQKPPGNRLDFLQYNETGFLDTSEEQSALIGDVDIAW